MLNKQLKSALRTKDSQSRYLKAPVSAKEETIRKTKNQKRVKAQVPRITFVKEEYSQSNVREKSKQLTKHTDQTGKLEGWLVSCKSSFWHGGDYRAVLSNTEATSHIYLNFNKNEKFGSLVPSPIQMLVATILDSANIKKFPSTENSKQC